MAWTTIAATSLASWPFLPKDTVPQLRDAATPRKSRGYPAAAGRARKAELPQRPLESRSSQGRSRQAAESKPPRIHKGLAAQDRACLLALPGQPRHQPRPRAGRAGAQPCGPRRWYPGGRSFPASSVDALRLQSAEVVRDSWLSAHSRIAFIHSAREENMDAASGDVACPRRRVTRDSTARTASSGSPETSMDRCRAGVVCIEIVYQRSRVPVLARLPGQSSGFSIPDRKRLAINHFSSCQPFRGVCAFVQSSSSPQPRGNPGPGPAYLVSWL